MNVGGEWGGEEERERKRERERMNERERERCLRRIQAIRLSEQIGNDNIARKTEVPGVCVCIL